MSPRDTVPILRILYPIWIAVGMFGLLYVPSALIVAGNAAETAANILSNTLLFRMGIVASLITQLIYIAVVLLLYRLFAPHGRRAAVLMVILALVSVPIAMTNELFHVAALLSLDDPGRMMLFLELHAQGVIVASIFWGLWLFPLGSLIRRSGYFPTSIGIAVSVGGFGYLLGSFLQILLPSATGLLTAFEAMTFGEVVFVLWLIVRGVRLPVVHRTT